MKKGAARGVFISFKFRIENNTVPSHPKKLKKGKKGKRRKTKEKANQHKPTLHSFDES
jgi:hypothetical protein